MFVSCASLRDAEAVRREQAAENGARAAAARQIMATVADNAKLTVGEFGSDRDVQFVPDWAQLRAHVLANPNKTAAAVVFMPSNDERNELQRVTQHNDNILRDDANATDLATVDYNGLELSFAVLLNRTATYAGNETFMVSKRGG